ncbi:MAG TPA: BrnA antitoxin family protein [Gammaproteobacteria bacterium]|nr:BrnA antitoxin family protein [Gammaproteobacteria bacterium]
MSKKRTSARSRKRDVPYESKDRKATLSFWDGAVAHRGVAELRAKRGRPRKAAHERKEQIALRVDADVLAWYRAQGEGWQTRMNAVLKAYKEESV